MNSFFFLENNYIEDEDSLFRFNYVHEFLKLAIQAPRWSPVFNLGLRIHGNRSLIGFITSISRKLIFQDFFLSTSEINFLCLDRKFRKKRIVSSLIKEETRRLNLVGTIQAIYTTGLPFSNSIVDCQFYHFPMNFSKLSKLGFRIFLEEIEKLNNWVPEKTEPLITNPWILEIYKNFRKFYSKFKAYKFFDVENFKYWFKTIPGVLYGLGFKTISTNEKNAILFYSLPSKMIKSKKSRFLYSAYFYQGFTIGCVKNFYQKVFEISYKLGFDMFNAFVGILDIKFFSDLKFKRGTGKLQFHIFNWKYEKIKPEENGLFFF